MFRQVKVEWRLDAMSEAFIGWAAQLHEIGLVISHSSFHKHGAYLLQHADMLGFTRSGQAKLAALVRSHRRKLNTELFNEVAPARQKIAMQLSRLLRLAVTLNHSRGAHPVPVPEVIANGDELTLTMPEGWLAEHPLTARDLCAEATAQKNSGFELNIS